MAYDEYLAERVERFFTGKHLDFFFKKMMGGLVFMVNEKMCVGVLKDKKTAEDKIMLRIGKEFYEEALKSNSARKMDFTGVPMKGFVFIGPDAFDMDDDLEFWLQKALDFNPEAKKSPPKKKKSSK
jgi:hypothetical protein